MSTSEKDGFKIGVCLKKKKKKPQSTGRNTQGAEDSVSVATAIAVTINGTLHRISQIVNGTASLY